MHRPARPSVDLLVGECSSRRVRKPVRALRVPYNAESILLRGPMLW